MFRNTFLILFFTLITFGSWAQGTKSKFSSLSSPEKWWVIWHPFKVKSALEGTIRTLEITDSIKNSNVIGDDINGGNLDAFKHAYWMADLSKRIGSKAALKLGEAHEKGNYRTFQKGETEDGYLPDKASSDMDLFNNLAGASLHGRSLVTSEKEMINEILNALLQGELKIIKKDGQLFLNCKGDVLDPKMIRGKWENDKCLIPSNSL